MPSARNNGIRGPGGNSIADIFSLAAEQFVQEAIGYNSYASGPRPRGNTPAARGNNNSSNNAGAYDGMPPLIPIDDDEGDEASDETEGEDEEDDDDEDYDGMPPLVPLNQSTTAASTATTNRTTSRPAPTVQDYDDDMPPLIPINAPAAPASAPRRGASTQSNSSSSRQTASTAARSATSSTPARSNTRPVAPQYDDMPPLIPIVEPAQSASSSSRRSPAAAPARASTNSTTPRPGHQSSEYDDMPPLEPLDEPIRPAARTTAARPSASTNANTWEPDYDVMPSLIPINERTPRPRTVNDSEEDEDSDEMPPLISIANPAATGAARVVPDDDQDEDWEDEDQPGRGFLSSDNARMAFRGMFGNRRGNNHRPSAASQPERQPARPAQAPAPRQPQPQPQPQAQAQPRPQAQTPPQTRPPPPQPPRQSQPPQRVQPPLDPYDFHPQGTRHNPPPRQHHRPAPQSNVVSQQDLFFGGRDALFNGGFAFILDASGTQRETQPDPRRAKELCDGLQPFPPAIMKRYEVVCEKEGMDANCSVCWEGYKPTDAKDKDPTALWLPCTHVFHRRCIEPWFARVTTCPLCRFELDPHDATLLPPMPSQRAGRWKPPPGQNGPVQTLTQWIEDKEKAS